MLSFNKLASLYADAKSWIAWIQLFRLLFSFLFTMLHVQENVSTVPKRKRDAFFLFTTFTMKFIDHHYK